MHSRSKPTQTIPPMWHEANMTVFRRPARVPNRTHTHTAHTSNHWCKECGGRKSRLGNSTPCASSALRPAAVCLSRRAAALLALSGRQRARVVLFSFAFCVTKTAKHQLITRKEGDHPQLKRKESEEHAAGLFLSVVYINFTRIHSNERGKIVLSE